MENFWSYLGQIIDIKCGKWQSIGHLNFFSVIIKLARELVIITGQPS